jgi:hypothetical protein
MLRQLVSQLAMVLDSKASRARQTMSTPTAANGSGKVSLRGVCPARRAVGCADIEERSTRPLGSEKIWRGTAKKALAKRWGVRFRTTPIGAMGPGHEVAALQRAARGREPMGQQLWRDNDGWAQRPVLRIRAAVNFTHDASPHERRYHCPL